MIDEAFASIQREFIAALKETIAAWDTAVREFRYLFNARSSPCPVCDVMAGLPYKCDHCPLACECIPAGGLRVSFIHAAEETLCLLEHNIDFLRSQLRALEEGCR